MSHNIHRHALTRFLITTVVITASATALTACTGGGFDESPSGESTGDTKELTSSDEALTILIGSSGDAETKSVEEAVSAWSADSGIDAKVQVASDLSQELSQGFAAGSPADLFYLSTEQLAGYAKNGSITAYGDQLSNKDDFYPTLIENFTYQDEFYCAPKDFSTLALVINNDLWKAAGLTDSDYPTSWEELTVISKKLTSESVTGLTFGAEYQRVGAFMTQAGGGLVKDGKADANSTANIDALTYVQQQLDSGNFAYSADLGAGWGGEAFGKGLAAMVIEGNWISGSLSADYPDLSYTVVELPAGPGGNGTMQFTNCWGMAADSANQEAALSLVEYLTTADQQLAFSEAFGPMPSVLSAASKWSADNPELAAFLTGADYAQFVPNAAGTADIITDFNAGLESLKSSDPKTILETVQSNLEAILN